MGWGGVGSVLPFCMGLSERDIRGIFQRRWASAIRTSVSVTVF